MEGVADVAADGRRVRQVLAAGDPLARPPGRDGGRPLAQARRALAPAGGPDRLHFSFGLRGKTGLDAADATFTTKVLGPDDQPVNLPVGLETARRGSIPAPASPGEYKLQVTGKGKDPADGGTVEGTRTARFVVTHEDVEKLATAANHDLLSRLATATGGQFHPADERLLLGVLNELKGQARARSHLARHATPTGSRPPRPISGATSFAPLGVVGPRVFRAVRHPPRVRMAPPPVGGLV